MVEEETTESERQGLGLRKEKGRLSSHLICVRTVQRRHSLIGIILAWS